MFYLPFWQQVSWFAQSIPLYETNLPSPLPSSPHYTWFLKLSIGCLPNPMWPASCHPILLWPAVLDYPATQKPPITFSSVQSLSHVWLFATPWTAAYQASLSITNSQSLLKPMSIESVMPSNHLILSPPTFNLSQHQGLFKWVSSSHQVAKVLEFQLQHQSFQWIFKTHFL